jgi:uncharacterized protein
MLVSYRMNRAETLTALARVKPELERRFGVRRIALFGSFGRDQARPNSDIDLIVQFDGPATAKRYFGVQFLLEDLFGRRIDLVTNKALRPEFRQQIERELVDV